MLTRIAVVGEDEALVKALQTLGEGQATDVVPVAVGAAVPAGATAAAGSAGNEAELLRVAQAIGGAQESLLQLLSDAVDSREGIKAGSGRRLQAHAARMAQALGLSASEQHTLERGALLHDIGKIRISNEVLLKKSVLDYDEWLLLQQHTDLGADLLESAGICTDVVDIVRYHHECWDGDGYPHKLEGENIPYLARIMKLLDVYCAMTSPRHYRSTFANHEQAAEYLQNERGKHYEAALVDAFLANDIGQPWEE